MNFFTKDSLDELENPRSMFRNDATDCPSPTKLKAKELFFTNSFLAKRESMDMEEPPELLSSINDKFAIETLPIAKDTNEKAEVTETHDASQKIDEISPLTIKDEPQINAPKFAKTNYSSEKYAQIYHFEPVPRLPDNNFLSEDEERHKKTNQKEQKVKIIEKNSKNIDVKSEDKRSNEGQYHKLLKQRKSENLQLNRQGNKKKNTSQQLERNQLKSRINKVNTFWKGANYFIPNVFRLVNLKHGATKVLMEYQDFSMKGLCHINNALNEDESASKLSNKIDLIGKEYLHENDGDSMI